ncbi:myosin heavy chain, clone 203-like [Macrobrachium rosenbergii]|uniref:myosin heavy chain, clone 203-like n=1 Tax=Macrobrachium rosenbergii TaxID=79674 RepID=UPI0034D6BE2C
MILEENEHEREDLTIIYDNMLANKDRHIDDLLAKEKANLEACDRLKNELLDALSDKKEVERRLQEKEDLVIYYQTQITKKDDEIYHLMDKEDEMKKEHQVFDQKLGDALNNLEIENREQKIHELLAQEENMEGKIESLEEKLAEALCNIEEMEKIWRPKT